jgi:beta-barrel assembly-enhancing protease
MNARLHFPNGPLHGLDTQLELQPDALCFLHQGQWQTVSYDVVKLAMGGWDSQHCEFTWEDAGAWLLSVPAKDASFLQRPPAGLAGKVQALDQRRHKARLRRGCGCAALVGFLVAPVVLLALFWVFRAPLGSWTVSFISPQQETQFGDMIFNEMHLNLKEHHGPALEAVQQIGTKLTDGSVYTYKWHVVDDPMVNAFAVPGGHIVVNTGLIKKAKSAEELAGVLAHEVQHIEQRHSLRGVAGNLMWQILIGLVWDSGSTLGGVAGNLGSLSFSRDDESEADAEGIAAMSRAGIDPQGMVKVMRMLATDAGGLEISLLQTHPATQERVTRLETLAAQLPAATYTPLPLDWEKVQQSLKH